MTGRRSHGLALIVMKGVMIANRPPRGNSKSTRRVSGFPLGHLSAQVDGTDLLANVTQLATDGESCLMILLPLLGV